MAKARETSPDPPVQSEEESGEEESSSEGEEIESDSEPEPESAQTQATSNAKKTPAKTAAPASKKPETQSVKAQTPASDADSSSEGSESESDSESPPKKPDPTIKPIASKPMDEPQKSTISTAKKPRSKPNGAAPTSPSRPSTSAGAKRAAALGGDSDTNDAKRSKRKAAENSEKKVASIDEGRKLFARVWSEEDEIVTLKGMIDYYAKKKSDPVTDLNAFLEFIKHKLHMDVSKTQLQDKIRRLKKKYENNAGRGKSGKLKTFTNPHELKAYEWSKKIWGSKENDGEAETFEGPKANGTPMRKSRSKGTVPKVVGGEGGAASEEEVREEKCVAIEKNRSVSFVPDGQSIEEWVLKDGMEFMEEEDRVEMEKKWKQCMTEETGFLVRKLELKLEHAKKVFKGLKSSGD